MLDNGIVVHRGVHRRCDVFGTSAGQSGCGEHVVGDPVGQFGNNIGGGRCNKEQFSLFSQGDMRHVVLDRFVESICDAVISG